MFPEQRGIGLAKEGEEHLPFPAVSRLERHAESRGVARVVHVPGGDATASSVLVHDRALFGIVAVSYTHLTLPTKA